MDNEKLASELLKLAKNITADAPDHDKAYSMIEHIDKVCIKLNHYTNNVEKSFKNYEEKIKQKELEGSGKLESPVYLKTVLKESEILKKYVIEMVKEIKLATGTEE